MTLAQSSCEDLSVPQRLEYHKMVMKEAARFARDSIVVKRPLDPLSQYIVCRSIARALWKQDRTLADRLVLAHPLARDHLELPPFYTTVELKDPV
eukprot:5136048-Pyramimonas_sp.AAC.1